MRTSLLAAAAAAAWLAIGTPAPASEAPRTSAQTPAQTSAQTPAQTPAASRALDYVAVPRFSSVTVNPANTHAAFVFANDEGRRVLAVVDLANPADMKPLVAGRDADITWVRWASDRRLVYQMEDGELISAGPGFGLFAVDLDGGRARQIVNDDFGYGIRSGSSRLSRSDTLPFGWWLYDTMPGRGDEVLMVQYDFTSPTTRRMRTLALYDTFTGKLTDVGLGLPDGTQSVLVGPEGRVIAAVAFQADRERLLHRPAGSRDWTVLHDVPAIDEAGIWPRYVEADGTWVVETRQGRDTFMLATYDPRTRQVGAEPLVAVDGFDIGNDIDVDPGERLVVGVGVYGARWQKVWFDERLALVQREVDAALPPGRTNVLVCGHCLKAERFVVRSYSDRAPSEFWVYDRPARRILRIGSTRPWISADSQGRRTYHRVPARDGLPLPVFVTHPPGVRDDEPRPTVMLVHGGPWVRGSSLEWDAEAAFLASRGFRVLQPEFRGSTGFGQKHFRAGWRQWGQAMQDDLADVMAWADQAGLSEPGRACIMGASYGGYAAMMGPIRHPALWRCAVSLVGVSDKTAMFKWTWTDIPENARRHTLPQLIGDPKADAEMLRRYSPVHRAAEVKVPVLLGHGTRDRRVDPDNSERFADAARRAGVPVQLIRYENEGHGFYLPSNHADWLERVAAFLQQHLGKAP